VAILVVGKLRIASEMREEFIRRSVYAVKSARKDSACLDYAVSPDPIDPARVNVYECWVSREALESFRGSGPDDDLFSLVESFDVSEHEIED
jgi:quinol monooxygenase YgiN